MIDLEDGEIIVDNFAGGGGASVGIEMALGRSPDEALNHDPEAIAMHAANHPHTHHHCQDIWSVSPLKVAAGRRVGLAWFSPDCKDHSKAKGGKPVEKKIRDLAWVVCWWAHAVKPRIILLENVEEFAEWGPLDENNKRIPERKGETFQRWLKRLRELGYHVEYRELKACDYGAPTSRNRLYVVARRDSKEIVWPQPTHGKGPGLQPYRTAAECIDWSIPALSIFATKDEARAWAKLHRRNMPIRPLAENTLRRTARGIFRYVIHCASPFVVRIGQTGHGDSGKIRHIDDSLSTITTKAEHCLLTPLIAPLTHQGETRRCHPGDESLPAVTGAHRGELALLSPILAELGHGEIEGRDRRPVDLHQPLTTQHAGGNKFALVAPTLVQSGYGERPGQAPRCLDIQKPNGTAVGCGVKHALVTSFLAKAYGDKGQAPGSSLHSPIHTITAVDHHSLIRMELEELDESYRDRDQTDSGGRDRNPSRRDNLEAEKSQCYASDSAEPDGQKEQAGLHDSSGLGGREMSLDDSSPSDLDLSKRPYSRRDGYQPQGRKPNQQSAGKPGDHDTGGQSAAFIQGAGPEVAENDANATRLGSDIRTGKIPESAGIVIQTDREAAESFSNIGLPGGKHEITTFSPEVHNTSDADLLQACHIQRDFGQSVGSAMDDPSATITGSGNGKQALVACHIQRDFSKSFGSAADDPSLTITGGGSGKSALVASTLIKLRGSVDTHPTTAQDLREPAPTFTAHGNHVAEVRAFLIKYFETGIGMPLTDPLHTITTRDRFGLVLVQGELYQIVDITLRMLDPRELFLAQGFPPTYKIDIPYQFNRFKMLTKTAQVRMVGNSVSPPVAAALVLANVASKGKMMQGPSDAEWQPGLVKSGEQMSWLDLEAIA